MSRSLENDDSSLMSRLQSGDHEAFHLVYERFSGAVYRFALSMSADAAIAEEVTQETFVLLLTRKARFEAQRGPLAGWLLGIARNLVRRTLSARLRAEPLDRLEQEQEAAETSNILATLSEGQALRAVQDAIGSLPVMLREVVILCELQELDYATAAVALECPVGTVRSRLHRARTLLSAKLKSRCLV